MSNFQPQPPATSNSNAGCIATIVVLLLLALGIAMLSVADSAHGADGTLPPPETPAPTATPVVIVLTPVICVASPDLDICLPVGSIFPRLYLPTVATGGK